MTTDKKTYPGVILLPWITIKEPVKVGRYSLISTDELEFSSKRLESRRRLPKMVGRRATDPKSPPSIGVSPGKRKSG